MLPDEDTAQRATSGLAGILGSLRGDWCLAGIVAILAVVLMFVWLENEEKDRVSQERVARDRLIAPLLQEAMRRGTDSADRYRHRP